MLTHEQGVAPFRYTKHLSESDKAAPMGGTSRKVSNWWEDPDNPAASYSDGSRRRRPVDGDSMEPLARASVRPMARDADRIRCCREVRFIAPFVAR
jgi:hypothetical protein